MKRHRIIALLGAVLAAACAVAPSFAGSFDMPGVTMMPPGKRIVQAAAPRSCTSAAWLGFVGDGVALNDALLAGWFKSLPTAGGCLEFPAGVFVFSGNVAFTMPNARSSITIRGVGRNLTRLHWPNSGGGLTITAGNLQNNVSVRDMTMTTAAANSGTALHFVGVGSGSAPTSDITNVDIEGDDLALGQGAGAHYWATGVLAHNWGNFALYGVNTFGLWGAPGAAGGGVGLTWEGDVGTTSYATILNVVSSSFNFHVYGAELNSYWQGVTFDQCNFNGEVGSGGIIVPGSLSGTLALLSIFNSQFNTGGPQVDLETAVDDFFAVGNVISVYTASATALLLNKVFEFAVTGNVFNSAGGSSQFAAAVGATGVGSIIGNSVTNINAGINLQSGSTLVTVGLNAYSGVSTKVINNGTNNSVGTATIGNMTGVVP